MISQAYTYHTICLLQQHGRKKHHQGCHQTASEVSILLRCGSTHQAAFDERDTNSKRELAGFEISQKVNRSGSG